MGKKSGSRKQKALAEIERLKGRRRASIVKAAAIVSGAVVFLLGERMLEISGVLPSGSLILHGLVTASVVIMAAAVGITTTSISRIGREIKGIADNAGLAPEDLKGNPR